MQPRPILLNVVTIAALALSAGGCDMLGARGGVRVRAELVRMEPAASPVMGITLAASRAPGAAPHWSSDVQIQSLRVPISRIWLVGSGNNNPTIYSCPGSSDDACLVELNGPALEDVLKGTVTNIPAGTYTALHLNNCSARDAEDYDALLSGSVTLDGTTYHSRTDGTMGESGPAQAARMPFHGCSREWPLGEPLVVNDTLDVIPIRLYFDTRDIAFAMVGPEAALAWGLSGCGGTVANVTIPRLCLGYPDVVASRGMQLPKVERYRVNESGTVGLYFDPVSDKPLGGYTRMSYGEGRPEKVHGTFQTPVKSITPTGGGVYHVEVYGSTLGIPGVFPAFQRATHSGTYTDWRGDVWGYNAVRMP
jgi:hypothetical protein